MSMGCLLKVYGKSMGSLWEVYWRSMGSIWEVYRADKMGCLISWTDGRTDRRTDRHTSELLKPAIRRQLSNLMMNIF